MNFPSDVREPVDIYAAVWTLLHRLSADTPFNLMIEDLYWADFDTLNLVSYLLREGPSPAWPTTESSSRRAA